MTTWRNAEEPPLPPISAMGWLRVVLRGGVLAVVFLLSLGLVVQEVGEFFV